MFDELAEEVQIGMSVEFFRALVAIDPAQVWDEYEDFLELTKGDTSQYDLHIRMTIAPALAEKETDAFWEALSGHLISIPDELFED